MDIYYYFYIIALSAGLFAHITRISNISNLEQLSNIEFESESENEPEGKDKSKLDYLGETFNSSLNLKGLLSFNFFAKNLFCQNFICEVPTSPPNNC